MLIQRGVKNVYHISGNIKIVQTLLLDPLADYLVYDTFTETSDTALASHAPEKDSEGGGWAVTAGTWTVREASDDVATGQTTAAGYIDAGTDNVDITCSFTLAASGDAGIIYRYQDIDNLMLAFLDNTNNQIHLYKKVSAGWTSLGSTAMTLSGTTYVLRVTVDSSDDHEIFVDGVSKVTVAGDGTNAGNNNIGVYNSNAPLVFDTFFCEAN